MKAATVTRRIYLDPTGKNSPPPDSQRISTERAFLEHALSEQDLYIQYAYLCRWAETFFVGREQAVETLKSQSDDLRDLCPALSVSEVDELLANVTILPENGDLSDYAQSIFGSDWWTQRVGWQHAAHWLQWWLEHTPSAAEQTLLAALADQYQRDSRDTYATFYDVTSAQEADKALRNWLGYTPSDASFEGFPHDLPAGFAQQLRGEIMSRVLEEGIGVFQELQQRSADQRLLELAAEATANYLEHNKSQVTEATIRLLGSYLTDKQINTLRDSLPLTPPTAPPAAFEALTNWFLKDYLPYRTHKNHESEVIDAIGRSFAEKYLHLYRDALNGSADNAHLSWQRAHQHEPDRATLMIVLDGLSVVDMEYFWRRFNNQSSNTYTLLARDVAFAVLPSITEVAKPPLFYRQSPNNSYKKHQQGEAKVAPVLKKDDDLLAALQQLQAGQTLIWSLLEPDKGYHQHQQKETAQAMAQGSISGIIQRLTNILEQIPDSVPLDLIITTDHGRLLGESQRTHPAPAGMTAQGRAALGYGQKDFPEAGYIIEEDIVYLHAGRFHLPSDAAMLITQDSFLTSDGKRGTLAYPHGGILPEEVLIPCWHITRSQLTVEITVTLRGTAEAGKPAVLTLEIKNANRVNLDLQSLELDDKHQLALSSTAPAMKTSEHQVSVEAWFSKADMQQFTPHLHYQTPDGKPAQAPVSLAVETQEMYAQDDILGDLL